MSERNLLAELRLMQLGGCGICGDRPAPGDHLIIDHDHDSGMVRGLLCRPCNTMEGQHSCRDCLPGQCPVDIWRRSPAVSWVGWTERYEYDDRVSERERKLDRPWAPAWIVAVAEREIALKMPGVIAAMFPNGDGEPKAS